MKKIALVQMTSTPDQKGNLEKSLSYVEQAAQAQSDLVAFPENFLLLGNKNQYLKSASSIPGDLVKIFQEKAKSENISILMGSLYETIPDNVDKIYNTSVLIDRCGNILCKYRKIHLFDVSLPDVKLFESELVQAGSNVVVCDHEIGIIGLSICYDVRFPGLYNKLLKKGAQVIFVPAAFTVPTGKAHWINLLRTRAIENQVYIAAPAQFGRHSSTRESFGNTVIIDPWGEIIALSPDKEEIIYGDIDINYLKKVRQRMPVQEHTVKKIDY